MHTVYLALGSNIGNRHDNLCAALSMIENQIGHIMLQSDFITTAPQGFDSPNQFLNMVLSLHSNLTPTQILDITQDIERQLGRNHKSTNGIYHDRTIDIDILLYDDLHIKSPRLTIPHPRMTHRTFVMQPLTQIAPNLIIPGETQTTTQLLTQLNTTHKCQTDAQPQ